MDSLQKKPLSIPSSAPSFRAPITPPTHPSRPYFPQPLPSRQKPRRKRIWLKALIGIVFLSLLSWLGYFGWKAFSISQAVYIHTQDEAPASGLSQAQSLAASLLSPSHTPLKGEEDGRINILLLGKAGEHYPGHDLTDTIMVMSLDTKQKKIALLSLPRDLYVNIPRTQSFTKINSIYQYGLGQNQGASAITQTVENITGLHLHYFFIIDFNGFERIIDTLGGIHVEVMRDIYDARYPGPNYSYQTFEIKKGWQELDGATALKYARERHDDPEGDFGRAKRQQQIIQAVKNKAFSLQTFVNALTLNDLLNVLGESVKTNIAPEEIEGFIALAKQMDTQNITNVVVDAWSPESLLRVSHVQVGPASHNDSGRPTAMFILVPRVGNWSEVQDLAANLFDLNTIKRRQEAILQEGASVTLLNLSGHSGLGERVRRLLKDNLGFDNVETLSSSAASQLPLQEKSLIIDHTGRTKPFSLDEILKKFPAPIGEPEFSLPEQAAKSDIVFVIGQDLEPSLNFEEDSVEDFKNAEDTQDDNHIQIPEDGIQ